MSKHSLHAFLTAAALLSAAAPRTAAAAPGPGLGNLDCGDAEYNRPFAFLENGQGPNGTNVAVMIRGYFMTIFAPDSGAAPGEIGIYDLSDPKSPDEVRHIENSDTNAFREAHSLPIGIIDGRYYIAVQTIKGIQFWDFTDPLQASRIGHIDLPGVSGGDYENVAWQATWQGRYLYVSGGNRGIWVVDASDPTSPELLNQVQTSVTGGFRVGPLFAVGDFLVISNMDQDGAYAVLDISVPDQPALLSQLRNLPRIYTTLVGANDRIYAAGRDGDFVTHSFADPTRITEVKNAPIGQDQLYVAAQDEFIFLGRQNNYVKVDVTNEQDPRVVGEGNLGRSNPDHGQVTPMGNLLFIGNDHGTGSALFCHQRGRDTRPPVAQSVYPKAGSTRVPTAARVNVIFSDFIDTDTILDGNVVVRPSGGQPLPGLYTYNFNTLSFGPDAPLSADTTYEVVLAAGGVSDVMGNALAEEVVFRFSTGDSIVVDPNPSGGAGGMGAGGAGVGAGGTGGGAGGSASGGGGVPAAGAASIGGAGGSVAAGAPGGGTGPQPGGAAGTTTTAGSGGVSASAGRAGAAAAGMPAVTAGAAGSFATGSGGSAGGSDAAAPEDGGCTCAVVRASSGSGFAPLTLAALGLALLGLRRRASRR